MAENTPVELKVTLGFRAPPQAASAATGEHSGLWAERRAEFWQEFERRNQEDQISVALEDAEIQAHERKIKSDVPIHLKRNISNRYKDDVAPSTIDDLEVFIKKIDYGSIELYIVIFGALKLLSEAGITVDDFKTGIEVLTPIAMQLGLNAANVNFDESTATIEGEPSPEVRTATRAEKLWSGARQITYNTFFLIPGVLLFAAAFFYIAPASEERRDLIKAISDDRKEISDHRKEISNEFSSLLKQKEDQRLNEWKLLVDAVLADRKSATDQLINLAKEKDDQRDKLFNLEHEYLSETSKKIMVRETAEPGALKIRNERQVALLCPGASSGPVVVMSGQLMLTIRGPYTLAIDGRLGGQTKTALLGFQRNAGLPQSGAFDVATLKALGIGCPETKAEAASDGASTP